MKPTDAYIAWLQAHPAVWEALHEEWKPRATDLFGLSLDWYVVATEEKGHTGVWAIRLGDIVAQLDFFTRAELRAACRWLPTLGQLVRMLQQEWSDWENRLEIWILKETAGNKGAKAVLSPKEAYLDPVESSEWEWEPEIACTTLWAKVKGVE